MKKMFIVGETVTLESPEGKLFADILSRTKNTVTYKRYFEGKPDDGTVKTSELLIKPVWDENYSSQVGEKESFIGWGTAYGGYDDGEYEECYSFFFA